VFTVVTYTLQINLSHFTYTDMMIDYMDSAIVERADSTSTTVDRVGEDTSAPSSPKKPRLLGQYDAPVTAGDSGNDTSAT